MCGFDSPLLELRYFIMRGNGVKKSATKESKREKAVRAKKENNFVHSTGGLI